MNEKIPHGWTLNTIKELGNAITGNTPPTKDPNNYGGKIPFIKPTELIDRPVFHGRETISEIGAVKARILPKGGVLVSCIGNLGKTAIAKCDIAFNQQINAVIFHDNVMPEYGFYYFQTIKFRRDLESLSSATTISIVNKSKFESICVPVAPLKQQKRIVAKIEELFSHIDAGITALNKSKQLLKQYRQSVLKAAVTGELTKQWREENKDTLIPASELLARILAERKKEYSRKIALWETTLAEWKADGEQGKRPGKPQKYKILDSQFDDLEQLPTGWRWEKLGNLSIDVSDGPFGSNLKSNDYVDKGVRVIRLENIGSLEFKNEKNTYVTEEKYQLLKKHTVSAGDIIFSSFVIGGTRVVVLPENITRAINKADCFSIRTFGASIDAGYLANYLATTSTYKRLENQVHGATRPRINTTQLKELEVPVCSIEEQQEIVSLITEKFEALERLDQEIDRQLTKSERTKQSILASAFSGKLTSKISPDQQIAQDETS